MKADPLVKTADGARRYPGSKGGAGVWQTIVNQIPPHHVFVEAFCGSAQLAKRKRPAAQTILIDRDPAVIEARTVEFGEAAGVVCICADAVCWLGGFCNGGFWEVGPGCVVYCDPPYLFGVRDGGRRPRYRYEFGDPVLHQELLCILNELARRGVRVLVSGYRSALYDCFLNDWRRVDYLAPTPGGQRPESLWCNFPAPEQLHDYSVAGENFRERERLKRKKARWIARLKRMGGRERAVLLSAIDEWRQGASAEVASIEARRL